MISSKSILAVLSIWDGVDEDNLITVKESSGGTPTFSVNHDWGEGSYVMAPYAVTKIDANKPSEHYRVLVKHTDTYSWEVKPSLMRTGNSLRFQLQELLTGNPTYGLIRLSPGKMSLEWINGDDDFSGYLLSQLEQLTRNQVDGVVLGSDADGALWITDGETNIQITDNWIEQENFWDDGGFTATAIAATKNNNNTPDDISDDYYQLAVKQTNTFTDWHTGVQDKNEDWQIYAVNSSGNINWSNTFFTQSIQTLKKALVKI